MIKVAVFCAAGMSTSLLVKKIKDAAAKRGVEIDIDAYSESDMIKHTDVDAALLGPQIMVLKDKADKVFGPHDIPVEVINTVDYGMMNGDKVLTRILELVQ